MYHGDKGKSEKACLCCGKTGHVKANCVPKDETRSNCGKTGHLEAARRAKAASQVEEAGDAGDGEKSTHMVPSPAMVVAQTGHDENGTVSALAGARPPRRRVMCRCLNFKPER